MQGQPSIGDHVHCFGLLRLERLGMCESASGESADAPLAQRPGPRSWLLVPLLRSCLSSRAASLSGRGWQGKGSVLIKMPLVRLSPETNHAARLSTKVHIHGLETNTAQRTPHVQRDQPTVLDCIAIAPLTIDCVWACMETWLVAGRSLFCRIDSYSELSSKKRKVPVRTLYEVSMAIQGATKASKMNRGRVVSQACTLFFSPRVQSCGRRF